MIIEKLLRANNKLPEPAYKPESRQNIYAGYDESRSYTSSGQYVTAELAKTLASAYRCGNVISDDVAAMSLQVFERVGRNVIQQTPDAQTRNLPYLLEVNPNRWMTPFVFKKTAILWLIYYGNAYLWMPLANYREIYILEANKTTPVFDEGGNLWYKTRFPNGEEELLPQVEVAHLKINSTDGLVGRSVISYAKETMGRQLSSHETQNTLHGKGLNPSAVIWLNGEASAEARNKVRDSYLSMVSGSKNAGGAAVFDNKIAKFETVSMTPDDAQFLETIEATDADIANFFGVPLYKLNQGKQSYESNAQQNLDYLRSTLNPYLVQWEQEGRLRWLSEQEQAYRYLKFNRETLLQMTAQERAQYMEKMIFSGQMTPNEGRAIQDQSAYDGGDRHYVPGNMVPVD